MIRRSATGPAEALLPHRLQHRSQGFSAKSRFRQDWRTSALQTRHLGYARPECASSRTAVVSLFGFGSKSAAATESYICIDCGYIYVGADFSKEPNSYKCPACDSPKRRWDPIDRAENGMTWILAL